MTPFMLFQQGHCLARALQQKRIESLANHLLFQYLLLVHPVGDARDGVLVVASVGGHSR